MEDIDEIVQKVAKIEYYIKWRSQNYQPGRWRSITVKGSGSEFHKVVEYIFGDDPRTINWNATSKTGGQIVLKNEYLDKKDITIYIVVDVSNSMNFGTKSRSKKTISAEIAAILSYSAYRMGDGCGLVTWPAVKILPPKKSEGFFLNIAEEILSIEKTKEKTSLKEVLDLLPSKRCMVFVVSDFLEYDTLYRDIEFFAKAHDLIPVLIEDQMEVKVPKKFFFSHFKDLETGKSKNIVFGKKTLKNFMKKVVNDRKQVLKIFRDLGIFHLRFRENYEPERITEFFMKRKETL